MHERNTEQKNNYFRELALNLRCEGFAVGDETDGLLPVEMDGQQFCSAMSSGSIRYWREDITNDRLSKALERVTDIARSTDEYMSHLETAPFLKVGSLEDTYRLLSDFNGTVLAGQLTKYGAQFITWERGAESGSLNHGHYYGPNCGVSGYAAAKQDFATRSGLVSKDRVFSDEQLTEIYRSVYETFDMEYRYPITDSRRELLKSACKQIEDAVPDLDERVNQSNLDELDLAEFQQNQGMGQSW